MYKKWCYFTICSGVGLNTYKMFNFLSLLCITHYCAWIECQPFQSRSEVIQEAWFAQCEIIIFKPLKNGFLWFLSDYFMKHSLMHASLHLIWLNLYKINNKETSTNYYNKTTKKSSLRENQMFNLLLIGYICSKKTTTQKKKRKRSVWVKSC